MVVGAPEPAFALQRSAAWFGAVSTSSTRFPSATSWLPTSAAAVLLPVWARAPPKAMGGMGPPAPPARALTALIEDALRELLARAGSARGAKRRVTLPVFRGGAGARPGGDIGHLPARGGGLEARRGYFPPCT